MNAGGVTKPVNSHLGVRDMMGNDRCTSFGLGGLV